MGEACSCSVAPCIRRCSGQATASLDPMCLCVCVCWDWFRRCYADLAELGYNGSRAPKEFLARKLGPEKRTLQIRASPADIAPREPPPPKTPIAEIYRWRPPWWWQTCRTRRGSPAWRQGKTKWIRGFQIGSPPSRCPAWPSIAQGRHSCSLVASLSALVAGFFSSFSPFCPTPTSAVPSLAYVAAAPASWRLPSPAGAAAYRSEDKTTRAHVAQCRRRPRPLSARSPAELWANDSVAALAGPPSVERAVHGRPPASGRSGLTARTIECPQMPRPYDLRRSYGPRAPRRGLRRIFGLWRQHRRRGRRRCPR